MGRSPLRWRCRFTSERQRLCFLRWHLPADTSPIDGVTEMHTRHVNSAMTRDGFYEGFWTIASMQHHRALFLLHIAKLSKLNERLISDEEGHELALRCDEITNSCVEHCTNMTSR